MITVCTGTTMGSIPMHFRQFFIQELSPSPISQGCNHLLFPLLFPYLAMLWEPIKKYLSEKVTNIDGASVPCTRVALVQQDNNGCVS